MTTMNDCEVQTNDIELQAFNPLIMNNLMISHESFQKY